MLLSKLLNRLTYMLTGVSVRALQDDCENYAGTAQALATLAGEMKWDELSRVYAETKDSEELGNLFTHYGSDKANWHNYHLAYASLLRRDMPQNILEIGIGTNDPNVPSSMGVRGKPGASLRAFRDWGKQFEVYGADVDKHILFTEERIKTFFVDQTHPESLSQLAANFSPESFDLIIDDGLHNTWANLNTFIFARDLIKSGGYFIVEDIRDKYIPLWNTALSMIGKEYRCQFLRATGKQASICVMQKL